MHLPALGFLTDSMRIFVIEDRGHNIIDFYFYIQSLLSSSISCVCIVGFSDEVHYRFRNLDVSYLNCVCYGQFTSKVITHAKKCYILQLATIFRRSNQDSSFGNCS